MFILNTMDMIFLQRLFFLPTWMDYKPTKDFILLLLNRIFSSYLFFWVWISAFISSYSFCVPFYLIWKLLVLFVSFLCVDFWYHILLIAWRDRTSSQIWKNVLFSFCSSFLIDPTRSLSCPGASRKTGRMAYPLAPFIWVLPALGSQI